MTRRAPAREVDIRRAIRAARRCGLTVVGVKPDGTVLTNSGDEAARDVPLQPEHPDDPDAVRWGGVRA